MKYILLALSLLVVLATSEKVCDSVLARSCPPSQVTGNMARLAEKAGWKAEAKKSGEYTEMMEAETRRIGKSVGKDVERQIQCFRIMMCRMPLTKAGLEFFIHKLDVFETEIGGLKEEYEKVWNNHKEVLKELAKQLPSN
ncbi:unnamed protein product [Bursaphelenchus okinawaensis]|uniref:Uncharacterized protein n=1 Tax=Bursaphelenchus okinawaensis TaxID=465554 RepID=A0A811KHH5_9BILA|nr:unnamed protein product [Bursaphelenchus okinawaensis]CAG9103006.1 unnamed protein product [Bursaphelenchus okinawaensis]